MKFSVRQILASVTGAVTAALIASTFGVTGTIIGVAIGSAVATIATAFVAQSIERGHDAVKQVVVRAPESSTLLRRLGSTRASGSSDADAEADAESVSARRKLVSSSGESRVKGDETIQVTETKSPAAPVGDAARLEVSAVADAPASERLQAMTFLPDTAAASGRSGATRRFSRSAIAGTAAIVFVLALALVTGIEFLAGAPTLKNLFVPPASTPRPSTPPSATTTTTSPTPTTSPNTTTSTTAPSSSGATTTTTGVGSATTTTTTPGATTTTTSPTPAHSPSGSGGSATSP